jgi:archaellin
MGNYNKLIKITKYVKVLFLISILTATMGCTAIKDIQDKATGIAADNMEDISTGLRIRSIEGIVGNDGKISMLYLRVTTQAGSQSVDLSQVMIHMSDGKGFFDLFYLPNTSVKQGFTVNMLLDSKTKFTSDKPKIEKGDLMAINIDTIQNGISLSSGDIISISFESAMGNKAPPLEFEIETLKVGPNQIY